MNTFRGKHKKQHFLDPGDTKSTLGALREGYRFNGSDRLTLLECALGLASHGQNASTAVVVAAATHKENGAKMLLKDREWTLILTQTYTCRVAASSWQP